MNSTLARRAGLLALALTLLPGCSDLLEEPAGLPPPPDLGGGHSPLNGIPSRAQLAGTWRLVRDNGSDVTASQKITVSFFTDGTYLIGGENNAPDCTSGQGTYAIEDSNGNGVEFGELLYSETSGQGSAGTPFLDSNGDCGFHETTIGATQDVFRLRFIDGVLQATDVASGNRYDFEPVARGSGVVGSWYVVSENGQPAGGTRAAVATFLADGHFILLSTEPQAPPSDDPGAQVGRYSIGSGNLLTVSNVTTNTCNCGFDNADNNRLVVTPAGQLQLTFDEGGSTQTVLANPMPLANRFSPAEVVGTWARDDNDDGSLTDETEPVLVSFFANGRYLLGGHHDDPDCVSDYAATGVAVEANGDGYEVGSFRVDPTTGRLIINGVSETDGSCGVYDLTRPDLRHYLQQQSGNLLSVASADHQTAVDEITVIRRVPVTAGSLLGAWRGLSPAATAEEDFVVAYVDDSTAGAGSGLYLAVDARPGGSCAATDPGPVGGISAGSYLYNAGSGVIDYAVSAQSQCPTRFDPAGTQTLSFSADGQVYTDTQSVVGSPPASFSYRRIGGP